MKIAVCFLGLFSLAYGSNLYGGSAFGSSDLAHPTGLGYSNLGYGTNLGSISGLGYGPHLGHGSGVGIGHASSLGFPSQGHNGWQGYGTGPYGYAGYSGLRYEGNTAFSRPAISTVRPYGIHSPAPVAPHLGYGGYGAYPPATSYVGRGYGYGGYGNKW